ncbi:hypothetical protein K9U39_06780 [Rhodoblastus acidophilus]|uniref:Prolyl 4-hydroxylase alpha subunit Fe(2+) 2OG dioxygenase domain-containing protein n=1 Tax=Candidatus Rhodoblastus alkanivorans TaxID=2954117 RepID=A0ABS9Z6U0_9HYPH|nr:hypothetical protein [Candidatus Rhodoblastus alkanivorans]MCI4680240.1 hypothetical protein [Candidatus Rhodoblastus alkanivorans]MCI4683343.1 hypothetical protein [Candidatus Rhodoblastus alkanivorans]MDI4640656.1 hypothetical protein [Rhodoblastus acidophilus]
MADTRYEELVAHAVKSIMDAEVWSKPYPHMIFRDFWPEDFYRELNAKRPEEKNYFQLNGANTRRQFTLFDGSCDAGDDERRALWKLASDVLSAPELEAAMRTRLDEGLKIRSNASKEGWPIPMYPRPVLYCDYDGYRIKPHPDTRRKVITMMIYMPEDDSQKALGTTLYRLSPQGLFSWKHFGLAEEKTVPFLPNSGCAFVVIHPAYDFLHTSWHGRESIAVDNDRPRFSILNTYYAEPVQKAVY